MAKFNLKKILINDYDIELIQAMNFEQWVNRNMDYPITYGKDVKDMFFKSERTNKKEFLKDIKRKANSIEQTRSIKVVLDVLREEDKAPQPASTELYDKLRKIELENNELKGKITTLEKSNSCLAGDLRLMELKNIELLNIVEICTKFNDESVGFLKDLDLGFNIEEYKKAVIPLVSGRTQILKELMVKNGMPIKIVDKLIEDWKLETIKKYKSQIIKSRTFAGYENNRERVREQFSFIAKNSNLIEVAIKLKKAGCSIKLD